MDLKKNDLVWAKDGACKYWPGEIEEVQKGACRIKFFNCVRLLALINKKLIRAFKTGKEISGKSPRSWVEARREARRVLDSRKKKDGDNVPKSELEVAELVDTEQIQAETGCETIAVNAATPSSTPPSPSSSTPSTSSSTPSPTSSTPSPISSIPGHTNSTLSPTSFTTGPTSTTLDNTTRSSTVVTTSLPETTRTDLGTAGTSGSLAPTSGNLLPTSGTLSPTPSSPNSGSPTPESVAPTPGESSTAGSLITGSPSSIQNNNEPVVKRKPGRPCKFDKPISGQKRTANSRQKGKEMGIRFRCLASGPCGCEKSYSRRDDLKNHLFQMGSDKADSVKWAAQGKYNE